MTLNNLFPTAKRLVVLLAFALGSDTGAIAQLPPNLSRALTNLASEDLNTRSEAFYALLKPFWGNDASELDGIAGLLSKYPNNAESIKTALIRALDGEAAYEFRAQQHGEYLSETFSTYQADLITVVGTFRDQRAVRGLLAGLNTGGIADNALGDLCPGSVDELIRALHEPEHYFKGMSMNWRSGAIAAIGACFERPVAMRSDSGAAARARSALLSALDDNDPDVRGAATASLAPLRTDPVVRARLELVVRKDPFTRKAFPNEKLRTVEPKDKGMRFGVREAAAYVLAMPDVKSAFFVMRTPDAHECRIQGVNETPAGEQLIGPFDAEAQATRSMCRHVDRAARDPSQCWLVYPRTACSQ